MILDDIKKKRAKPIRSWILLALCLVLFSSLYTCSTKNLIGTEKVGSILVKSNVPGANIMLGDNPTGKQTPDTLKNVPVGRHEVSVKKEGYNSNPESDTVEVVDDSLITVNFSLTNKLGAISVDSDPQGAEIILDQVNTHKMTPDTLDSVAVGKHVVSVEREGYRASPEFDTVEVVEDSLSMVNFLLVERLGNIFVNSNISGAEIILDDVSTGQTTPDTIFNVRAGDHTVSVTKEGYFPSPPSMLITVNENQTSTVEFDLVQKVGSIFVNSAPPGADIILDHVPTGKTTPDTIFNVAVGDHIVSVVLEGYLSFPDSMPITVNENQTSTAEFDLMQMKGSIYVNSDPPGADIILDHVFTSKTTPDMIFNVPVGDHVVSVIKEGYVSSPDSLVVVVTQDEVSTAEFILLNTLYGSLKVSSNVDGAVICVDKQPTTEVTPHVFFNNIPVGTRMISIFKEGYSNENPTKEVVNIATKDTAELYFTLSPAEIGKAVGNITPDFELEDDYETWHRLYAHRGFVTIINFWAEDCSYCMKELPHLQEIYDEYLLDTLIIFGINYGGDFGQEGLEDIQQVRKDLELEFTLLIGAGTSVKSDYEITDTPVTIILDRGGKIYYYVAGFYSFLPGKLRQKLDELFGK